MKRIFTVKRFSFDNDVGGTELMDRKVRVAVVRSFHDYETGQRFIGNLIDERDIAAMRRAGTTGLTPKDFEKYAKANPSIVESASKAAAKFADSMTIYFSEFDIVQK